MRRIGTIESARGKDLAQIEGDDEPVTLEDKFAAEEDAAAYAVAEVVERLAGRAPVWLSGQFLSVAHPGDVVEFEVHRPATGRRLSQLRVVGTGQRREIVHVAATLGAGSIATPDAPEPVAPDVLPPEDCPPRPVFARFTGTIIERVDIRLVRTVGDDQRPGRLGRGRAGFWARLPELETSPAAMAILGDFVPAGIGAALPAADPDDEAACDARPTRPSQPTR
ncbi:MAG: hypothetical protein WEB03_11325 [Nitriliruptor sp.]